MSQRETPLGDSGAEDQLPIFNTSLTATTGEREKVRHVEVGETSLRAYRLVTNSELNQLQQTIITLLTAKPMTDDEMYTAYLEACYKRLTRQRVCSARAEFVKLDKVTALAGLGKSALGNPAKIWQVK